MVPKGAKMVGKAAQQVAFDSLRKIQCQGITSPRQFLYGQIKLMRYLYLLMIV